MKKYSELTANLADSRKTYSKHFQNVSDSIGVILDKFCKISDMPREKLLVVLGGEYEKLKGISIERYLTFNDSNVSLDLNIAVCVEASQFRDFFRFNIQIEIHSDSYVFTNECHETNTLIFKNADDLRASSELDRYLAAIWKLIVDFYEQDGLLALTQMKQEIRQFILREGKCDQL